MSAPGGAGAACWLPGAAAPRRCSLAGCALQAALTCAAAAAPSCPICPPAQVHLHCDVFTRGGAGPRPASLANAARGPAGHPEREVRRCWLAAQSGAGSTRPPQAGRRRPRMNSSGVHPSHLTAMASSAPSLALSQLQLWVHQHRAGAGAGWGECCAALGRPWPGMPLSWGPLECAACWGLLRALLRCAACTGTMPSLPASPALALSLLARSLA